MERPGRGECWRDGGGGGVMQKEMAGVEGDREEETFRHVHHLSNQTRTDTQTVQLRPEHIYFSL